MADWTNIADAQVDPKAPITSELMNALRDNPIAIAEGRSGAPKIANSYATASTSTAGAYLTFSGIDIGEGFEADLWTYYTTSAGQTGTLEVQISDDNITWSSTVTLLTLGVSANININAKFHFDRQTGAWFFIGGRAGTTNGTLFSSGTFATPTNTAYIRFRVNDATLSGGLRILGKKTGGLAAV